MPLPTSSLSVVCRAIADFVSNGLHAQENSIRIMIGNPGDANPAEGESYHHLNLFFYRMEPMGFGADGGSDETWWLRLHCLVTAFGVVEDQISPGENDLRLIGETIRLFHEHPVLSTAEVDGEMVELQVVFRPLSPDDINHIWSTQGDVKYRTSVAYEMAVVPIVPSEKRLASPLVGATGQQVTADAGTRYLPFAGVIVSPPVYYTRVDTDFPHWVPHICFVYQGECAYSLAFERHSDALDEFTPGVWIAGEVGDEVRLYWDLWSSNSGWETVNRSWLRTVSSEAINPGYVSGADLASLPLPRRRRSGQRMLYAIREYQAYAGGPTLYARSNPLLVTIYEAD